MTTTRWVLLVGALAFTACGGGSSGSTATHDDHAGGGEVAATGPLVPVGEAVVGDRSTCTVSGDEFTVTESSPHAEYEGRTYYFCCPGCVERFQANPQEFVHAPAVIVPTSS